MDILGRAKIRKRFVLSEMMRVGLAIISPVIFLSADGNAQLSPGDLHTAHADLEGLKNCGKCHETGNQISAAKCLECHKPLKERIEGGAGLHSNDGYGECTDCHVEHLGPDSELIWWKDGIGNFNHLLTGYSLQGKHLGLECRKCHSPKNIVDTKPFASGSANLDRTFLGLSKKCLNCHRDEHRGRTSPDCLTCHDMNGWKPPSGFDHKKTDFPLSGRHLQLNCDKCHKRIADNIEIADPDYLDFGPLKHNNCIDCHSDIHKGKFEQTCETCHSAAGWLAVEKANFDHGKTGFPLLGRHAETLCEKCHSPGRPLSGLKHTVCADCHSDYHAWQFKDRQQGGRCEECHTVDGFSPARFGIEEHNNTKYPLAGAHLAIPCVACHPEIETNSGISTARFRYESTRCFDCHGDPHKGAADKYFKTDGCEFCHSVESWKAIIYGHEKSGFGLSGRHGEISCKACHKSEDSDARIDRLRFAGLSRQCVDCHNDIHMGQFKEILEIESRKIEVVKCDRCHAPTRWKPSNFDHNIQAAFKLEGAHLKIPCTGCHKDLAIGGKSYMLYKPLDSACASCHKPGKTVG